MPNLPQTTPKLTLTLSLAELNVATTKSIGIFNYSVDLANQLAQAQGIERLAVLGNRTLDERLRSSPTMTHLRHDEAIRGKLRRILWDQWGAYAGARRAGTEWLLLPKGFASFARPCPVKLAGYIHDIMGEYYHEHYRGYEPALEYLYFARSLRAALRQARVLFTNSAFTRSELIRLAERWRVPAPPIIVAGYGFEEEKFTPPPKEHRILLFASKVPHKQTGRALEFLEQWLQRSRFDGQIDCIGIVSEGQRPISPQWNWIGRVPPQQGLEMMRRSRVVLYFSEYEGFGRPPVEAILNGACPVFSDIPPVREVMQDAGFGFSNDSADGFAAAMNAALKTTPAQLAVWSRQLLARHDWPGVVGRILGGLSEFSRSGI